MKAYVIEFYFSYCNSGKWNRRYETPSFETRILSEKICTEKAES